LKKGTNFLTGGTYSIAIPYRLLVLAVPHKLAQDLGNWTDFNTLANPHNLVAVDSSGSAAAATGAAG
jgi:hypothetical protein